MIIKICQINDKEPKNLPVKAFGKKTLNLKSSYHLLWNLLFLHLSFTAQSITIKLALGYLLQPLFWVTKDRPLLFLSLSNAILVLIWPTSNLCSSWLLPHSCSVLLWEQSSMASLLFPPHCHLWLLILTFHCCCTSGRTIKRISGEGLGGTVIFIITVFIWF